MSSLSGHIHRFSDFTIDTEQKVLLRGGTAIPLAPKVFETLLVLVENHGRIVLKEELMKRLWPDTFVEESNLTFNIQQLRKCLGDNARMPVFIETIPRRGYRFIADVEPLWIDHTGAHSQAATIDVPAAPRTVARTRARSGAILAVIAVIAIAGIGLVFWILPRRGESSLGNNRGDGKTARGLKLVELT
ncbi:MAG TPA: transcriptional regulator, partial [Candidatus Udaeobacter sp.]|nr:transcriptional regulator [Candidatus Udaeobacter sp.]